MIRSSSMEQAVSILEEAGSGISIYHTPSGDDEPPLPKTPEPPRSASTVSNSSHFYLSPSFEINRSFRFLDDSDSLSPGISLVSSSSDIGSYLTPDGGWSSSPMATVDVRSSHGPGRFYTHHSSSLDSLDGLASSSNYDETGGSSNGIPLSRTSQPSLHFHFDDEESHLNESHRSRSLDDLSKGGRTDADSSYHSLGRVRRDSPASNNNNNIDKLTDFPALEAVSYAEELDNQNDAVFDTPEPVDSFPGSPRDDFGEKSRLLELPSISEETEETTRSRHSSASMHGSERHHLDYDGVPEPDHIAPGSYSHQLPKDFQELPSEAPIYHRRVVSDNHVNYSKPDEAFLPDPPPYPVLIRDAPARGSQNGRCMSQHILTTSQDSSPVSVVSDRSLSKSDPHLEEKIEQKLLLPVEDDDVHQTKTPVPPPVILTRKNSVVKGSWQNYFHSSAATPHTVITPATAGLTSRPKLPSNGSTETVNLPDDLSSRSSPPGGGLSRSGSSSSVVAFVRKSIHRLSGRSKRASLPPSPEFVELVVEFETTTTSSTNSTLKRRNTTPNRKKITKNTAGLRSESPVLGWGSGVAKHKKSGSETFSIGSLFGGKKKPRSKLTNLINNASEPAPSSSTSSTLSTSSGSRQRGAIPSFHDGLNWAAEGLSGTVKAKLYKEETGGVSSPSSSKFGLEQMTGFILGIKDTSYLPIVTREHHSYSTVSSFSSAYSNTIVESCNVNGEDQRYLTIGICNPQETIKVENFAPDIRRSASSEMAGCNHRKDLSGDEAIAGQRRRSPPEVKHQRRNSAIASFNEMKKRFGFGGGKEKDDETPAAGVRPEFPDGLSNIFSGSSGSSPEDEDQHSEVDIFTTILENPRYARLGLFEEEIIAWHDKFNPNGLPRKAVKKQDAIYELIQLEKQHCANLAFLQEGYRRRLLDENILTREEVNNLIPDVIEALLLFHCNLLEHLQARQNESNEVETISDILIQEMGEDGLHTMKCIDAYTTFGSQKDRSEKLFVSLVAKNQRFMEFIKKCSSNRMYRLYDFRTIMTRTISRPAKYGLLIETIMKNECNQFSPQYGASEKAYETARRFAMRIDNNLSIYQMSRRWEDIKKNFDTSSQVTMFIADKTVPDGCVKVPWNLDSICKPMKPAGGGDKERKLMCIGEAQVKANGLAKLTPMHLVAFDDILVFLYKKNGKFVFAPMDQPVLSLHALIVRRLAGHSLNMMLITPVKSALIDLEFQTKVDLNKWTKVLDCAVHEAPSRVRLTKRENDEYVRQTTFEHEKLERKQKEIEETWMKQLVELFERQGTEEVAMFSNYVGKRNDFSTALQNHLEQIPLRGRPDLVERVKDSVRAKFRDLKQMKTVPMRKLIDDMTQAKETILWSYLQELENGTAVRDADSDGGSGSDSSGSGKSKQPRRIKTFSGATVESTSKIKGGIRRHTTVPRMGMKEEDESDDTRRETEQAEEKAHNLPLTQSLTCHRECRRLIKDLEKLKSENLTLKNELALDKLRITSLEKMRSTSSTALSTSVDTLEALRRKEKDVREEEIKTKKKLEGIEKEIRHQKEKLDEERKQFEEKRMLYEMEQKKQQAQLEEKWAALKEVGLNGEICSPTRKVSVPVRMNNDVCPAVKSPQPGPATMPSLIPTNLAVKTEYKKKK